MLFCYMRYRARVDDDASQSAVTFSEPHPIAQVPGCIQTYRQFCGEQAACLTCPPRNAEGRAALQR